MYDKLRVMQAVTTMQMNKSEILNTITMWYLINRVKKLNAILSENDQFENLLNKLLIIVVDDEDANYQHFNNNIRKIIMDFN